MKRINFLAFLGSMVILFGMLVEVPRYYETLPDKNPVVSLGTGLLLATGSWYIVEMWGRLSRRGATAPKGTNRLLVMVGILICATPAIMAPALIAREYNIPTVEVLKNLSDYIAELVWFSIITVIPIFTSACAAYANSLAASTADIRGTIASSKITKRLEAKVEQLELANKQLSSSTEQHDSKLRAATEQHELAIEQLASAQEQLEAANEQIKASTEQQEAAFVCDSCGEPFNSQLALNGHSPKRCALKQATLQAGNGVEKDNAPELTEIL